MPISAGGVRKTSLETVVSDRLYTCVTFCDISFLSGEERSSVAAIDRSSRGDDL